MNKHDRDLAAELQHYLVMAKQHVDGALGYNVIGKWKETLSEVSAAKVMLSQIYLALERKTKEEK